MVLAVQQKYDFSMQEVCARERDCVYSLLIVSAVSQVIPKQFS